MPNQKTASRDTLDRQLTLLELVAGHPRGMTFSDIRNETGLPKASLHRLLKSLIKTGCVDMADVYEGSRPQSRSNSGIYVLGQRIRRLMRAAVDPDRVINLSQSTLHELAKVFEETAFLSVLRDGQVESLAMATPTKAAHGYINPGRVMPPHAAAAAKAIYAFMDEEEWDRVLCPPLPSLTENTITSLELIKNEYRKIRSTGIAYCREEIDIGLMAIAAPIHLKKLGVVFAISIVGPTSRIHGLDTGDLEKAIICAADELSSIFATELRNEYF